MLKAETLALFLDPRTDREVLDSSHSGTHTNFTHCSEFWASQKSTHQTQARRFTNALSFDSSVQHYEKRTASISKVKELSHREAVGNAIKDPQPISREVPAVQRQCHVLLKDKDSNPSSTTY